MEEIPETKKALLNKILRFEALVFALIGFILLAKPYFSEVVLIDEETDVYLGYGLVVMGILNIFIANKFFTPKV